jgi:MFS family permease
VAHAAAIGTRAVFSSVLVLAVALAIVALRMPLPGRGERVRLRETTAALVSPSVLRTTGYVAAPSALFGVVTVLIPLRLSDLGGGAGVVAAGFMVGAALEAVLAVVVGRLSDRVGRLRPYAAGMAICAVGIALVPAGQAIGVVLALLVVISVGAGICFAPALTMLSDAADASGLHQGLAAGLINVAWAAGQVLGSIGGGAMASAAGNALPCLLIAGVLVGTALASWHGGVGRPRYVARA